MSKDFSIDQLKELMECVARNNLGELLLESESVRLRIRGAAAVNPPEAPHAPIPFIPSEGAPAPAQSAPGQEPQESAPRQDDANCVLSPLVGTFYSASGPDQDPFVKPGQRIAKGDVLFIIESMKVMNEVPSEVDGVVAQVLVEDGQPVEFGQPILRLE